MAFNRQRYYSDIITCFTLVRSGLAPDSEADQALTHLASAMAGVFVGENPEFNGRAFIDATRSGDTSFLRTSGFSAAELDPAGDALLKRLKFWRRGVDPIQPFRVLSNQALIDIAAQRPATLPELLKIKGIGPLKLELYGETILAIIRGEH